MKQKLIFLTFLLITFSAFSTEYYVDASRPDDSGAATNWVIAKKTIQAAVNLTKNGDTVWVTNGVYDTGGKVTPGYSKLTPAYFLTNRVCITNAITVRSVNGQEVTVIKGAPGSNGSNDVNSVRGVFMKNSSRLTGFTVTNGYDRGSGDDYYDRGGGGIWLTTGSMVSNCTISGNSANRGGGVRLYVGGTLDNCILSGNKSVYGGGAYFDENKSGSAGGTMNNCILRENYASYGGGASLNTSGTMNNCILRGNTAKYQGGGARFFGGTMNNCTLSGNLADQGGGVLFYDGGLLNNCVVWGNTALSRQNDICNYTGTNLYTCASDGIAHGVDGCVTNDPLFVDAPNGDFKLKTNSPCINSGYNSGVTSTDLQGNLRVIGGTVDMGAYEVTSAVPVFSITTTSGVYGSVTPANPMVFQGYERTFFINPKPGYHIDSLKIDGISMPVASSYTFTNVQAAHSIAAVFAPNSNTFYVDALRPDDSGDGMNWATAKKTIQAAVDEVATGGTVWVTNGIYDIGGMVADGYLTNRVCITRAITVRSVNGSKVTIIKGSSGTNGGCDTNSVRGVLMKNGCTLMGFTITGGYTMNDGHSFFEESGGGIHLAENCTVSDCIIRGNTADWCGAGALLWYGGTLNNCTIMENSAYSHGGGAMTYEGGVLNNCIISKNYSYYSGGVCCWQDGILNNCTVFKNSAYRDAGGAYLHYGGVLNNSIVWGNTTTSTGVNLYNSGTGNKVLYTCVPNGITNGVNGCTTNNPLFVDGVNSNFQLQAGSPCINAGTNSYAPAGTDMAGNPRIINARVDMGAYEFYAAQDDHDGDGVPNEWESRHFGNITRAVANEMCSNGVNTILQAYIAGLDPNNSQSKFQTSVFRSPTSGTALQWQGVSGRVYAVYFSTNLLNGFQPLETNIPWTAGCFTDSVHNAEQRFYRIEVKKP
jgi:hypothetical protein